MVKGMASTLLATPLMVIAILTGTDGPLAWGDHGTVEAADEHPAGRFQLF